MTKDVKVTGRIPMSIRKQVGRSRSGKVRRNRKTMKHKKIKKIRTPTRKELSISSSTQSKSATAHPVSTNHTKYTNTPTARSILKRNQGGKFRNKTLKRVRFNIETEGLQLGKFRHARRVKMKTAKNKSTRNLRSKNRTLKKRGFKIRFSRVQDNDKQGKHTSLNQASNLVERLKDFNKSMADDMKISRVQRL